MQPILLVILITILLVVVYQDFKSRAISRFLIPLLLIVGDVLFFIVLTTLFSPINFVVFFIGSIFLITLIYGGVMLFRKKKTP